MTRGLAGAAFVCVCTAVAQQLPVVETVPVIQRRVERNITLKGELLPYQAVTLAARAAGYIEQVLVDRGSAVRQGQVLVRLRAPELIANVAQAQARMEALAAQRRRAEAEATAARGVYEKLKEAARTEPGAISANELVQAEKDVVAGEASVAAEESAVKAARAAVDAVRQQEEYLVVRAPFAGVITERMAHPGLLVTGTGSGDGNALLRLEQVVRLRLVVPVPEGDAGSIATGTNVSFHVAAFPDRAFSGRIARLARSVDAGTRTMSVEADVANSRGVLAPGMYAEVAWPMASARKAFLVPGTSIVNTTERTFVVRIRDDRADWVTVRRGATEQDGTRVEVVGDLAAGDQVARRGSDEIRPGTRITARPVKE